MGCCCTRHAAVAVVEADEDGWCNQSDAGLVGRVVGVGAVEHATTTAAVACVPVWSEGALEGARSSSTAAAAAAATHGSWDRQEGRRG